MCKGGGCIKKLIVILLIFVFNILISIESLASTEFTMEDEISLNVYETKKVPYILISPDDIKITWVVANTEIATVTKKGVLKGLAVGMTKLTAFANGISENSTVYIKEPVPFVNVNYTKNIIFGFEPLSEYLINNEIYFSDFDGNIPIENKWLGKTLEISKKNDIEKCSSDKVSLFIEHTHSFLFSETVMPTCETQGYDIYKCTCEEILKTNYKSPLEHQLSGYLYDGEMHYQKCLRNDCDYVTQKSYHDFDNTDDYTCNICGFKRKAYQEIDDAGYNAFQDTHHEFDNDCDETCNVCNFKRIVTHCFDNNCDTTCNICNFERVVYHSFDNECDEICNICGKKIDNAHRISNNYLSNETSHYKKCELCGKIFNMQNHIFDNSCDTTCNICKFKRSVTHSFSDTYFYNTKFHYNVCTVCKKKFNKTTHTYDDKYDSVCNICGFTRKLKTNSVTSDNSNSYNNKNKKSDNKVSEKEFYYNKNKINYPIMFITVFAVIVFIVLTFILKEHKKPRT